MNYVAGSTQSYSSPLGIKDSLHYGNPLPLPMSVIIPYYPLWIGHAIFQVGFYPQDIFFFTLDIVGNWTIFCNFYGSVRTEMDGVASILFPDIIKYNFFILIRNKKQSIQRSVYELKVFIMAIFANYFNSLPVICQKSYQFSINHTYLITYQMKNCLGSSFI